MNCITHDFREVIALGFNSALTSCGTYTDRENTIRVTDVVIEFPYNASDEVVCVLASHIA
ncbi:hypothetical protein D3C77_729720 [compost metagenome]